MPKQVLPPNYVRPSLEEFKAAGYAPSGYDRFFEAHETELSRDYIARNPGALNEPPIEQAPVHSDESSEASSETEGSSVNRVG